jgi:hypothetical protein
LKNVEGLAFCYFDESDVVRHNLVQRIIRAYDEQKVRAENQLSLDLGASNGNGGQKSGLSPIYSADPDSEEYRYSHEA